MRYGESPDEAALVKKAKAFSKESDWAKVGTFAIPGLFHGEMMMFSWATNNRLHVYNDAIRRFPEKVLEVLKAWYPDESFRIEKGKLYLGNQELLKKSGMPCVTLPYSYDKIWSVHKAG